MLIKNKGGQVGMDYILAIAIGVFILAGVAAFLFRAEIADSLSGLFSDFEKEKKAAAGSGGTKVGSAEEKIKEIESVLSSGNFGLAQARYGEYIGEYFTESEFGSLEEQAKLSQEEMIRKKNEYLAREHSALYNTIKLKFKVAPFSNGQYEISWIGETAVGSEAGESVGVAEGGTSGKKWSDIEKEDSRRIIFSLDADKTLMFFEWKTGKGRVVSNINGKGYEEITDEIKSDLIKKIQIVSTFGGGVIGEVIDRIYKSRNALKDFVSKIPEISQFGIIGVLNEVGGFQSAADIMGDELRCRLVQSLDRDCKPQDIFALMYPQERYPEN